MKKDIPFDKNKFYTINEAINLVKENSSTKFLSSIDIAIKLNLDTSKTEQQLRGTLSLPYFFGKKKKILVIDSNLTKNDAKLLDVDFAGGKEIIEDITKGWLGFDLIITTPRMMPELTKLGKILGTRGLMPTPKNGNVTTNIKKTIEDFKSGITQYRTDSYGNIHMLIGKSNSDTKQIEENINFLLDFIKNKKPTTVKGIYIQNVSISSTMGPSVKILIQKGNNDKKENNKVKKHKFFKNSDEKRILTPIIKNVYESKKNIKYSSLLEAKPFSDKTVKKHIDANNKKKLVIKLKNQKTSKVKKDNLVLNKNIQKKSINNNVSLKKDIKTIAPNKEIKSKTIDISKKNIEKKIVEKATKKVQKNVINSKEINKPIDSNSYIKKAGPRKIDVKKESDSKRITPRKIELNKPKKIK